MNKFNTSSYFTQEQWISYSEQLRLIRYFSNKSKILEIGKGFGLTQYVSIVLLQNNHITFDNDNALSPDVVGDVLSLDSIVHDKYDIVCSFEVLEHLPFVNFDKLIESFSNITNSYCIISLPIAGRIPFYFRTKLFKSSFTLDVTTRTTLGYKISDNHFWEIGSSRQTSLRRIRKQLKKHFEIIDDYRLKNQSYHRFFVLKKYV